MIGPCPHLVYALSIDRASVVLKRRWPEVCVHDMAGLLVQVRNPLTELVGVGQCR